MHLSCWAALPLLLVACTGAPQVASPADRQRYGELLADTSAAPRDILVACGTLGDPLLRGDCQLAALARADRESTGDLTEWCGVVDRGRARDECWFVVAERRMRGGLERGAVEACDRSGGFEEDCQRHLWEQAIVSLTSDLPPRRWARALPRASADIARWEALLPDVEGLPGQMWTRFYERGLSRPGAPLDLGHCRPLPKADQQRCYVAGTALYKRRLARRADQAGADLCARAPRSSSWTELLPAIAHPRLDEAVADLAGERCAPD